MSTAHDDEVKRRILDVLQHEGRLTNQELAERIGLSPSPCWRRVRELEKEGVIRRYAAILDPDKVGVGECVFLHINLQMHNRDSLLEFERAIKDQPEIVECYAVTGDADFMLKVYVPNIRAYDRFLNDVVFQIPGVVHVKSSFTLREVKNDTALPLPER